MENKKQLAAFYTPEYLAEPISEWAIRSDRDTVLEPSFGGCCFLNSTWSRLRKLGCKSPIKQLYGADIDPKAFEYLFKSFRITKIDNKFVLKDFLKVSPEDFKHSSFTVVIGNPPYIANHKLTNTQRADYRKKAISFGYNVPGKVSAWVYFVLFAIQYLEVGGRMAWVLPWSILKGITGKYVLNELSKAFKSVRVYPVDSYMFKDVGTGAQILVLACENYSPYKHQEAKPQVKYCKNIEDLKLSLKHANSNNVSRVVKSPRLTTNIARKQLASAYEEILKNKKFNRIGLYTKASIGIVTGDAKRFLLNRDTKSQLGINQGLLKLCVAKGSHIQSVVFTKKDLNAIGNEKKPIYILITPQEGELPPPIKKYLYLGVTKDKIKSNKTFRKRDPWHSIRLPKRPDAFLRFFSQDGPIFIINKARSYATNSLYTLNLREDLAESDLKEHSLACIALSVVSCLGQAHSELYASRYGQGALKLDIGDVQSMPVHMIGAEFQSETMMALESVDDAIRDGKMNEAKRIANKWLIDTGMDRELIDTVVKHLTTCKKSRIGHNFKGW